MIMAFDGNLSTGHDTHLFWWYQQALHATRCVDEEQRKSFSIGVQTYICSMLEYFVRLSRHRYAARLAAGQGLLTEMAGVVG